jgi:hypothetical protein
MPHAEPVGIHILLAQPAFGSQASDSVAEGAKESRIVTRQVSAGAQVFRGNTKSNRMECLRQRFREGVWCARPVSEDGSGLSVSAPSVMPNVTIRENSWTSIRGCSKSCARAARSRARKTPRKTANMDD